ncbi:MAG: phosphoglycerate mutase family protein [Desulfobacterales bacterium]
MISRVFIFIILLCSYSVGCTGPVEDNRPEAKTTVILIRHAERDNFFVVTAEGHARARALVDAVSDMGITAIYSPDLERNLETVKPLAAHLKIDITLTPRISEATIDKIVMDILTKHKGEVVLLVGNGAGNLRALHQRLGGTGDGPYQYGDLFIYTIPDQGPVKVNKSRYGL